MRAPTVDNGMRAGKEHEKGARESVGTETESPETVVHRPRIIRWFADRPRILDVFIILACTVPTVTALVIVQPVHTWLGYLCAAGVAVALWWRRSHPFPVLLVAVALAALNPITAASTSVAILESFFGVYTLASQKRLRTAVWGYLTSEALIFAVSAVTFLLEFREVLPAVFLQPVALIALAIGVAVRASRARRSTLQALIAMREERAAADERARITAEMHDVVAHSVTVMIALAGGARAGWDKHPQRARNALDQLGTVGANTLEEMQRILQLLRNSDNTLDTSLEFSGHNQPAFEELIDVFRSAGLPVSVEGVDTALPVEPALQTTVYRIVQEALTNSLRYATDASYVEVGIHRHNDRLTVTITDNGRPGPETTPSGSGVGLRAMRERTAAFGGTLEAGPLSTSDAAPGTGWRTHATLPLKDTEPE